MPRATISVCDGGGGQPRALLASRILSTRWRGSRLAVYHKFGHHRCDGQLGRPEPCSQYSSDTHGISRPHDDAWPQTAKHYHMWWTQGICRLKILTSGHENV